MQQICAKVLKCIENKVQKCTKMNRIKDKSPIINTKIVPHKILKLNFQYTIWRSCSINGAFQSVEPKMFSTKPYMQTIMVRVLPWSLVATAPPFAHSPLPRKRIYIYVVFLLTREEKQKKQVFPPDLSRYFQSFSLCLDVSLSTM